MPGRRKRKCASKSKNRPSKVAKLEQVPQSVAEEPNNVFFDQSVSRTAARMFDILDQVGQGRSPPTGATDSTTAAAHELCNFLGVPFSNDGPDLLGPEFMDLSSLDNTDDGQMSAGASAARAHHNAPKDPWNPHLGFGDLRGGGGDGSPEIIREYIEMEAYSPGVGFGEGLFDDEMSSGMDQNQEQSSPTDNVNVTGTESSPSLNENHDHEDESLEHQTEVTGASKPNVSVSDAARPNEGIQNPNPGSTSDTQPTGSVTDNDEDVTFLYERVFTSYTKDEDIEMVFEQPCPRKAT